MSETTPTEAPQKAAKTFTNHAVVRVMKDKTVGIETPSFKNSTELSQIVKELETRFDEVELVKVVRGKEMKFRETRQISLF